MDQRGYALKENFENTMQDANRAYAVKAANMLSEAKCPSGAVGASPSDYDHDYYQKQREQEIRDRFTYKAPKGDQVARYQALRAGFANLAVLIAQNTRPGQGQEMALQNLQIVSMVTNKAIADEY